MYKVLTACGVKEYKKVYANEHNASVRKQLAESKHGRDHKGFSEVCPPSMTTFGAHGSAGARDRQERGGRCCSALKRLA